ncbi:Zinc finger, DNL-type [Lasallia pustulata]|uniref:Zinc finger, DNL-type n=1 Tax=Lasallia pustulata TaxID=136370 RepID=A0A1W5CZV4_9LECA|nr:Zinc finger, DNL-type [Lasallia pustulata]
MSSTQIKHTFLRVAESGGDQIHFLHHRIPIFPSRRHNSSLSVPESQQHQPPADLTPSYRLTFTCKPCSHRSSHRVSKQGYHHGTVLITCPNCKNRHVIADHLKVFLDNKSTLEDILADANVDGKPLSNLLKKGQLGIRQGNMVGNEGEEDIEFWEDGTETMHQKEGGS